MLVELLGGEDDASSEAAVEAGVAGGLASEAGTFNTNSLRPIIQLFITLVVDPVKIMMILLAHRVYGNRGTKVLIEVPKVLY